MGYQKSEQHINNAKKASVFGLAKIAKNNKLKILDYNNNPNRCTYCNEPLEYNKRGNKFCDSSCAAKHNKNYQ